MNFELKKRNILNAILVHTCICQTGEEQTQSEKYKYERHFKIMTTHNTQ